MAMFQVGIIGCGAIFPMHAYSLRKLEDTAVAAVCDIVEEKAKEKAAEFHCAYFTDYKEMIDSGRINCVHICAPHDLHAPMTVYALEKGLHVMTEKPMAIREEDGERMMRAADNSKGTLGVIFQNRLNPGSQLAKKMLESGRLGKVLGGRLMVTWHRDQNYYKPGDWHGTLAHEGGGVVINQAIHTFDLARWLVNKEVVGVKGAVHNYFHPDIDVEDEASGVIFFQDGVHINYYASNNLSFDDGVQVVLHCEKGMIRITASDAVITLEDGTVITSGDETETVDFGNGTKNCWGISHYKQIRLFYENIKNHTPDFSAEEGFKTHKMITMLYSVSRGEQQ